MSKPLYSAYIINEGSRNTLIEMFPPQYSKVVAHHITVQFGSVTHNDVPELAEINVVGYLNTGDGLEVLIVSVNGSVSRPDGSTYHITWSLQNGYKPVDSNKAIVKYGYTSLPHKTQILTTPTVVHRNGMRI